LDQCITNKNEPLVLALLGLGAISIYHANYMKSSSSYKWFLEIKAQYDKKHKEEQASDCHHLKTNSDSHSSSHSDTNSNSHLNTTVENSQDTNYWILQNQNLKTEIVRMKLSYEERIMNLETKAKSSLGASNFDSMTDEELEDCLKNLELQKTEIQKTLADRKKETCVICLIGPRSHVLIPCGHKLFCGECSDALSHNSQHVCPICRTNIQQVLKVFG